MRKLGWTCHIFEKLPLTTLIFQNLHLHTSSAVNKLVEHDLFGAVLDTIHPSDPFKLIGGFKGFGYTFPVSHLTGEQFHPVNTGVVNLYQVLIQFAGHKQIGKQKRSMLLQIAFPRSTIFANMRVPSLSDNQIRKKIISDPRTDEVTALNLGADDYMTKPFSSEQLLARVRVALRHARQGTTDSFVESGKYTTGELTVDYEKHEVLRSGVNCKADHV